MEKQSRWGKKKVNKKNLADLLKKFKPPLELTLSEWADRYRMLSPEDSAEPGRWRTDRAPYQRGIMDAISDTKTEEVVVMASAQVGKTAIELNALGYFIHQDPSPMMIIMPTIEMSETFSKKRVTPMLRDTPVLSDKVKAANKKGSDNTVREKSFPGGYMAFVGANSPSSLASRPIRIVLGDEIDRFPDSAGEEGDPLSLVDKRTTTFRNRKLIRVSTPTIAGRSRIEALWNISSMERWNVPCPSCGELQPYEWGRINFDPVGMSCIICGALHTEKEWKAGSLKGKWIAGVENGKRRGFHLNELASPWKNWDEIISDFREKKTDKETLKVWVNTSLGEPWVEDEGKELDWEMLLERKEEYEGEVPEGVLILTCGVDVQDNRLEAEVVGWGLGKESWGIHYRVFQGDPGDFKVWEELERFLGGTYKYADGTPIAITATCVDTGGHHTQAVYDFVSDKEYKRIFAIKGQGGEGVPVLNGVRPTKDKKTHLWSLGVNSLKDILFSRLSLNDRGPGYCHFPKENIKGYGEQYFKGITAEKKVIGMSKGKGVVKWVKTRERNEPVDLRNYATAALEIANPDLEKLSKADRNTRIAFVSGQMVQERKKKRTLSKGVK